MFFLSKINFEIFNFPKIILKIYCAFHKENQAENARNCKNMWNLSKTIGFSLFLSKIENSKINFRQKVFIGLA